MLKKFFPGNEIDPNQVRKILLAEKYLETRGLKPQAVELQKAIEGKVDPTLFNSQEEIEHAKRAELTLAFLNLENIRSEARKLEDLAYIERRSNPVPAAFWAATALQVRGEPGECLAWPGLGRAKLLRVVA